MTYSVPEKAKLWREGWDAFKRTFLELLPWIAGLAVILALVDAPSLAADIEEAQTALQSLDPGSEVLQKDVSTSHILLKIFGSLCQFAGYFVFSVLYLRREPILMVPAFEPQLFLRWLGQVLLAALILIGLV
ncbi:MAG: hypothetical protein WAO98_03190, partial [Alphaproteobacteria bacterium]